MLIANWYFFRQCSYRSVCPGSIHPPLHQMALSSFSPSLFTSLFTSSFSLALFFSHPLLSPLSLDTPSFALPLPRTSLRKSSWSRQASLCCLNKLLFVLGYSDVMVCICVCVHVADWENCWISVLWVRGIKGGQILMGAIWIVGKVWACRTACARTKLHPRAMHVYKNQDTQLYVYNLIFVVLTFVTDE